MSKDEKAATIIQDERVKTLSPIRQLMNKPWFASAAGTILIFIIFSLSAGNSGMFNLDGIMNWSQVAAYLGIISVGACLLMIAGEFDLSVGSMIGFAGMIVAIPPLYYGWPVWASVSLAFFICGALGALNGYIVIKTKLPSFIVTLAFLFILRGLTLAIAVATTGKTIVSGIGEMAAQDPLVSFFFQGTVANSLFVWLGQNGIITEIEPGLPLVRGIPKVIIWWAIIGSIAAYVLSKTRAGNWILASGGDPNAANNVGVPVTRVKIALFTLTALCACLFATLQVADIGSASADRGLQKEFEATIAAVIGGTLLTGGYGSVLGACLGALIFGVVQIGLGYTSINSDLFRVFVGLMLLIAVIFNNYIRHRAASGR